MLASQSSNPYYMKKTFSLLLLLGFLTGSLVSAQMNLPPETAYRNSTFIPANQFINPTVVEVPFNGTDFTQDSFLVIERETNTYVPHLWRDNKKPIKTPIQILKEGRLIASLADGNFDTSETYAVLSDGSGLVEFNILTSETLITTSEIQFDFSRNVTAPTSISIMTINPDGTAAVALATTRFPGNRVQFPTIQTKSLWVVLEYTQPLRIAEVRVIEENQEVQITQGLRYLAQPGLSYEILSSPDRSVAVTKREGGNLTSGKDVVLLPTTAVAINTRYQPSDRDEDTIVDTVDNCPEVSNLGQDDINSNGVGDDCEDYDRDGVINSIDNCPDLPNQDQADEDVDVVGDVCDDEESRLTEKYAWALWAVLGLVGLILGGLFAIVIRHDPAMVAKEEENA